MQLPRTIPIFPLPSTVLFPGVPLSLHIFEPRYQEMVREALKSHELIGVAMLCRGWQKDYAGNPEIFAVGCVGRIVNVEPLPNGCSDILLLGEREFTITRQIFERAYRQAEVVWRRSASQEDLGAVQRAKLLAALQPLLRAGSADPLVRVLNDRTLSDERLVNFLSYAVELDPLERQDLLQAEGLEARAERLCEFLDFHSTATRLSPKGAGTVRHH